jgi:hypothetical protein
VTRLVLRGSVRRLADLILRLPGCRSWKIGSLNVTNALRITVIGVLNNREMRKPMITPASGPKSRAMMTAMITPKSRAMMTAMITPKSRAMMTPVLPGRDDEPRGRTRFRLRQVRLLISIGKRVHSEAIYRY